MDYGNDPTNIRLETAGSLHMELDRFKHDSLPRLNAFSNNAVAAVTTLRDDTARETI